MLAAAQRIDEDGGRGLLAVFDALESDAGGLGWLSLWSVASTDKRPEPTRTLSFALAARPQVQLAEAILLWLLRRWTGEDLSTCVNLLTSLERAIEPRGEPPATVRLALLPFVARLATHPQPTVRHSVLDFLGAAITSFASFVPKSAGKEFAELLETSLRPTAEDEEAELLTLACNELRSDKLPAELTSPSSALTALLEHVLARTEQLSARIQNTGDIANVVREEIARAEGIGQSGGGMATKAHLAKLAAAAVIKNQYEKQLDRVKASKQETKCIESAVAGVMKNLPLADSGAIVVYGDPQSGKTEMMICLTAKLLDAGRKVIVHLMNDSVDLLRQNLERFQLAGLAPAPRSAADLANSPIVPGHAAVLFCKKNSKDLQKLNAQLATAGPVVVIDDEADYATPNGKVNKKEKTKINGLVSDLLGTEGEYIGVTATPARLNLNNTFDNNAETWVPFPSHSAYTGQDHFFPQTGTPPYRLTRLTGSGSAADAHKALARFLVTVAHLNLAAKNTGKPEQNYSFLVHTSGQKADHKIDRKNVESAMAALITGSGAAFDKFLELVYVQAKELYGTEADALTTYVIANASRSARVVLNSERDRKTAGDKPTVPTCPFTVIIGGNIVSRGVTFPNLLSMFFTRDVKSKLQQDTYIQRARMFGSRGAYLAHFELTIPKHLYADWHRCFVFHRLALEAIKNDRVSPVWIGDPRISIASNSSIDRGTVDLDRGEMSFQMFDFADPAPFDKIVAKDPTALATLKALAKAVGDGLPAYLVEYIEAALKEKPGTLAIHAASSVVGYGKKDPVVVKTIARKRGFIGTSALEETRFPNAIHHIKIFYNNEGRARVFYKNRSGVQFVKNLKN